MTAKRLIELGIVDDLEEALRMFPVETLFRPGRRLKGSDDLYQEWIAEVTPGRQGNEAR